MDSTAFGLMAEPLSSVRIGVPTVETLTLSAPETTAMSGRATVVRNLNNKTGAYVVYGEQIDHCGPWAMDVENQGE